MRCALTLFSIWMSACSSHDASKASRDKSPVHDELASSASHYLAQHAGDPVHWIPWSADVSARAQARDALIFVSVGYATCHWCAVMHEESFQDPEVAAFLNEHFIAVKVDRDQRPDLDAIFMEMLRALGQPTGWPTNLVLTSDLEPVAGAAYLPPRSEAGRIGLLDMLRAAREQPDSRSVLERLRMTLPQSTGDPVEEAMRRVSATRDVRAGGFGRGAKFPHSPVLLAQLRSRDAAAIEHVTTTLDAMMRGGIRDRLEGTFHRYASDAGWHTPHYEKTLQSNAWIASVFLEAGARLGRDDYLRVAREVLDALSTHWRTPEGFISGVAADDPAGEGAYYRWTRAEVEDALGPDRGPVFAELHDLDDEPDVLHRITPAAVRVRLGMNDGDADQVARSGYEALREVRERRPPPERQPDVIVAYNAATIEVLANAGRWLDEPRYVEAASESANALLESCVQDEQLLRGVHDGRSLGPARLEDRASLVMALLRTHEADGDVRWLAEAARHGRALRASFDDESATFVDQADDLPIRRPDVRDEAGPAPTSTAALAALMLAERSGDPELRSLADRAAAHLSPYVAANPIEAGTALVALQYRGLVRREIVLVGDDRALQDVLRPLGPNAAILRLRDPDADVPSYPALAGKTMLGGRATVYVCEWGRCERPVHQVDALRARLPSDLSMFPPD